MNAEKKPAPLPLRWITGLFAGPRLPQGIALLVLAVIATHAALILAVQPTAYWLDPRITLPDLLAPALLSRGPWIFSAATLAYLLAAGLLLFKLRRPIALALAGMLFFYHTIHVVLIVYHRIPLAWYANLAVANLVQFFVSAALALLFLLALRGLRSPGAERPANGGGWRSALPAALPVLLAAGWLVLLVFAVARSAAIPHTGWQPLAPQHLPSARHGMGIAYDTRRGRAVMFGGEGKNERNQNIYFAETWEWDGKDWVKIPTANAPSGRMVPAMAYDESRGVVVLFGGSNQSGTLGDLWEYDGKTWKLMCPWCNPAARWGSTMFYNGQNRRVVLYGGVGKGDLGDNTWFSESWAWNGKSWEYQAINTSTPATFAPAMVYETVQQRIVAFIDRKYGGTWIWEGDRMTRLDPPIEPPHAKYASLVYDPLHARSVLFGGIHTGDINYLDPGYYLNQTWVFEKDAWRKVKKPLSPPPREDQVAFYDPSRRSMIVFGGRYMNEILGDMWELPLGGSEPGLPEEETP